MVFRHKVWNFQRFTIDINITIVYIHAFTGKTLRSGLAISMSGHQLS